MCLLVIQKPNAPTLPNSWLADFYQSNQDGVGVMYADKTAGKLVVKKQLPKSAGEFITFYHDHIAGKACAFHLRMKTHGNINLENCHPYEVLNQHEHGIDLWLMHNGILATGNAGNTKKSDTWHYIQTYLVPMLENNPNFAFTSAFTQIVSEHIGQGNKFILMDSLGRTAVVNQSAGVYWGGLWLSNTYAWSAPTGVCRKAEPSNPGAQSQYQDLWLGQVSQEPRKAHH